MSDLRLSATVFNEGSDARIRGVAENLNPHDDSDLANAWRAGWRDVDRFWGVWSRRPVAALPKV